MSRESQDRRFAWVRLLERRQRWGLTWRGWLTVVCLGCLLLVGGCRGVYGFLAANEILDADYLVVEGWIHQFAVDVAAEEFKRRDYKQAFVTGGPVAGYGGYTSDFNTAASVGADRLLKAGLARDNVQMVPSRVFDRDRTYSSAVALRRWWQTNSVQVKRFNVVTEAWHARRTRLLFEKAFGDDVAVGVIGVPSPDYDFRRWWRYSEGVKDVCSELPAYLYARLFFFPGE